jgi:signal transduction histidine kinase
VERDLHDGTQQRLVSVSMAFGLLESKLGSDPRARDISWKRRETLGAALQQLPELSQRLTRES